MHYNDTDGGHFSREMNHKNYKDKPNKILKAEDTYSIIS